jgi:hypothetical protein
MTLPRPADNQDGGKMLDFQPQQQWIIGAAFAFIVFVVVFFTLAFSGATNRKFRDCSSCRKLIRAKDPFCSFCGTKLIS